MIYCLFKYIKKYNWVQKHTTLVLRFCLFNLQKKIPQLFSVFAFVVYVVKDFQLLPHYIPI